MFSKKQRLKREEVGIVLQNPDFFFTSPSFSLKSRVNNLPYSRSTVVIPKKVEKSAVKRHFLKRRIISILKEVEGFSGLDVVLFLNKNTKNKDSVKTKNELEKLINKCIIVE